MTFVSRGRRRRAQLPCWSTRRLARPARDRRGRRAGPARVEGVGRLELFGEEARRVHSLDLVHLLEEADDLGDLIGIPGAAREGQGPAACCLAPVGFLIRA